MAENKTTPEAGIEDDRVYPRIGDKLFVSGSHHNRHDVHMKSIMWFYGPHASAFQDAADMVLNARESASSHKDELILPVAYLYRHALELRLKEVVKLGVRAKLYETDDVEKVLRGHKLSKLWEKAKSAITWRWPDVNDPDDPVRATESMVDEMNSLDPDSQIWRYETDSKGRQYDYEKLPDWISVTHLQNNMSRILSFLSGCANGIEEALQQNE